MELNFYTLCVLYLVYSFLGWVAETVVATIKGRAFVNRGVASGPFCFVYGTAAVLMAVGFADLRSTPVALFLGCAANATVVEWVTAKLLERMHRRRWWDYSDKKFNLDGYVCLQYSVLWGLLGMASVLPDFSAGLAVPSLAPTFMQMDFTGLFTLNFLTVVLSFLFVDVFDTLGGIIGMASQGHMLD